MTSATILPSIGPAPPEFRRPQVPENLRPQLAGEAAKQPARPAPLVQPDDKNTSQSAKNASGGDRQQTRAVSQQAPSANLGGASAVALQVKESASQASAKLEQTLETGLTDEEKVTVKNLKERDREVRAHENAHAAAGGGFAGAPSYEFTRGPDGVQYAVGGQVDIDVSEVPGDPRATIAKLTIVRSAALAPARPSGQDRAVAAAAAAKTREAEAELAAQEKEEQTAALEKSDEPESVSLVQAFTAKNDDKNTGSAFRESDDQPPFSGFGGGLTDPAFGASTTQPIIGIDLLV